MDMQSQMNAILQDPEMMQKISALAQSLNPQQSLPPAPEPAGAGFPELDPGMMQTLFGLAQKSGIDSNQQNLLHALGPYLKNERIQKLEKAMRAAKLAQMASGFLGSSKLFGLGR